MSKLLDLEAFAAHIEAATRKAGYAIEKREGADLYVIVHEEPMRCDLTTHYSAYRMSPHRLDDIVEIHLKALRQVPPPSPPPTEEEAAQSLLPLLQQTKWLKAASQRAIPQVAHRPFVKGVVITYVFDMPHYRAYVNTDMLEQMTGGGKFSFEEIHEYALNNLRLRTTTDIYETHGAYTRTLIVCETDDGYAATRILLPELMEKWRRRIPGRMLLGIPNRDFLIGFSERHPDVKALARQVRRDARQREYPLCPRLLIWEDGAVREYRSSH